MIYHDSFFYTIFIIGAIMRALAISAAVVGAMVLSGCQSTTGVTQFDKTAIGTVLGAAAGYGISKGNANSSAQNNRAIAIGAVVGGLSGAYLDNKEKKLRTQMAGTGVEVNRNADGSVGLVMPGSITFDTNKSNIKTNFYTTLDKVAATLTEDAQSGILVSGYTDSSGSDAINIPLSQARAQSVASYLASKGISTSRINAQGLGASNPVADNTTAAGKEQNRRVEISIYQVQ